MTRSFVYAREAQAELREIVLYTAQQWGAAQSRAYARQIDEAAEDLAIAETREQHGRCEPRLPEVVRGWPARRGVVSSGQCQRLLYLAESLESRLSISALQ